ncbi:M56 family metallopeptidase [Sediminibacterium ginsengisoli]|uniref:Signal transducer regulating beta-lactamase production, contains metallopeptidase domain n=1 Tax=Sediminibacterium ginsengisoli TaxID=413434 RepID=A0A1T4QAM4_9BACT|nr:hypothetical protein [Sediminibacterium ginsengisoli]SKA00755.1 Signal transducer regulating beta-lactamase production, contains metallopeptidase domain [Sediminibacterium ginsengisoli]
MIGYLLEVAAMIVIAWLFYTVLLRRETFFGVNRILLLSLVVMAFVLPQFTIPQQFSIRARLEPGVIPISRAVPVQLPVHTMDSLQSTAASVTTTSVSAPAAERGWSYWLLVIYWVGVVILGVNFLVQLLSVLYKRLTLQAIRDHDITILEEKGDRSPGSFWNLVFINPGRYEWDTYEQILAHEKIHARKKHTIDLLLAELLVIFQWFNVFAWLLRKRIEANLEYQADRNLLDEQHYDVTSYQLNLLKIAVPNELLRIQSGYNQSLLQKRILMMGQRRSGLHQSWKYLAVIPVLLFTMSLINRSVEEPVSTIAQIPLVSTKADQSLADPVVKTHTEPPVTEKKQKAEPVTTFRKDSGIAVVTEKQMLNVPDQTNELQTANLTAKLIENKPVVNTVPVNSREPVSNEGIYSPYSVKEVELFNKTGISAAVLKGYYDIGWGKSGAVNLVKLYREKITPAFIRGYQAIGLKDLTVERLVQLKRWEFSAGSIQGYHNVGLANLPVDSLYYLRYNNISAADVQGILKLGFTNVSCYEFVLLEKNEVRPSYIQSFQQLGFKDITLAQAIELKKRAIKASRVSEMMKNGLAINSISQFLQELKSQK